MYTSGFTLLWKKQAGLTDPGELSGGIHPACEDALFIWVSVLGHYRMLMEGRVDEAAELLNL